MRSGGMSFLLSALIMVLVSNVSVRAQHDTGSLYISPALGHWMEYQTPNLLDDGLLWGARLGVDLCPYFGFQGFVLSGTSELSPDDDPGKFSMGASYTAYGAGARLNFSASRFVPFLSIAGGKAKADFDRPVTSINGRTVNVASEEDRDLWMFGAGFEYFFHRNVGLHVSAYDHYVDPDFIDGDDRRERKTHNWEIGFGLTFAGGGGGPEDSDGDGVPDERDSCPNTPKGVKVYDNGCPFDSDRDGVPDYMDECPETEAGARVDAKGCPLPVVEKKEPEDSDGDGVPDSRDRQPDTPRGAKVDAQGRGIDSDNDGHYDGIDRCPDSPASIPVDDSGCPRYQPEQFETRVLFKVAMSYVEREYFDELDRIAGLMKDTWVRIRIVGYADYVGPEDYNMALADRRARAVRDYLATEGVPEDRMEVVAEGEFPGGKDREPAREYQRSVHIEFVR